MRILRVVPFKVYCEVEGEKWVERRLGESGDREVWESK
jgi:hypothetical protein